MVKDGRVKELRRLLRLGRTLEDSARMAEMSEKSARKYRDGDGLPSQRKKSVRTYRTRVDPFESVWPEVEQQLEAEPRLKAKAILEWLQQKYRGKFPDSTRRTLERRVNRWRSLHGPGKTVFFDQEHHPGRLAASDFTVCNDLGVRIAGQRFDHMFFHCVLTYSNVESVSLCFSESFEALSTGIQKAFWDFGGVPARHRSDSLAAAVRNHTSRRELTERYAALMSYYNCEAERTNARCANENGDVESSNGHLKDRIDQALMLRGSRTALFNADALVGARVAVVVEGEFDAMLLGQFLPPGWAAVTMGGAATPPGATFLPYFGPLERVLLCLDNDDAGQRALAAWRGLLAWAEVAPPLPGGAKDVTDFWRKQGDLDEWIKQCADTP